MERTGRFGRAWDSALRVLIGKRLETEAEGEERVGVATGLPILASDNISSSAYATEEAMRVLALAGAAALTLTMPIAIAVVFVLAIVILSESRVIRAYPNGGGSYLVARENHGIIAGLVAASALLIDYVLTVAVSTAAGVAAIASFILTCMTIACRRPDPIAVLVNRQPARVARGGAAVRLARATYAYMVAMSALSPSPLSDRDGRSAGLSHAPEPFSAGRDPAAGDPSRPPRVRVRLRGPYGQRAVANGVPSFRRPEVENAIKTLASWARSSRRSSSRSRT